jgi:hypothetical protein
LATEYFQLSEVGKDAGLSAVLGGFVMACSGLGFPMGGKPKDSQQVAPFVDTRTSGIGHAVAGTKIVGVNQAMLNKCANPGCDRRFRKLEDGKLFLVEVDVAEASLSARGAGAGRISRHLEHYWLCDPCASVLTLSFEPEQGVVAVPLTRPLGKMPAASVRSNEVAGTASTGICDRTQAASGGANGA